MPEERPEVALVVGRAPRSGPESRPVEATRTARWQPHEEVIDLLAEMLIAATTSPNRSGATK